MWLTGPNGVPQLVWLSLKPGLAGGSKLLFELTATLVKALGLAASYSDSRAQPAVRIIGSKGWNDGVDVQFPAALRMWEPVSSDLKSLLAVREATRAEAQSMLDANEKLGSSGGGGAGEE